MKEKTFHLVRTFSLTVCQAAAVSLPSLWLVLLFSGSAFLFYFLTRNKINPLMDIGSYELINCQ